ncbi:flagellar basal body L-ring protein FlgH [Rhodoferax saidenbachensis]|uniref:Flagellar biosynthesis protein FlgH n=1 Tax=Rhodoferax saidenbachensis TaxID=1484693 RepID=A0A1P8KBC9_9BURK|nr:flagellar basal body L-ring protein FlgH [Rhodoferax saidenbachensis]APW43265.1 flagellar biosynthesis protein FlgH [Rhodoferax saidenbachensis]
MNSNLPVRHLVALSLAVLLAGCANPSPTILQLPAIAAPIARPANVERVHTGSLFNPTSGSLYTGRQKARAVGDIVKVNISETLSASNTVKTDISRESALTSKGTGNANADSLLSPWLNQNDAASGSNTFKGNGTSKNDSKFTGQLATSVINVLANGNLVVAGERSIALQGNNSTLRFSGVVDPKDMADGNVIQSNDVVNARLEVVGQGDTSDAASRNWLQRVLNNSLAIW